MRRFRPDVRTFLRTTGFTGSVSCVGAKLEVRNWRRKALYIHLRLVDVFPVTPDRFVSNVAADRSLQVDGWIGAAHPTASEGASKSSRSDLPQPSPVSASLNNDTLN